MVAAIFPAHAGAGRLPVGQWGRAVVEMGTVGNELLQAEVKRNENFSTDRAYC